MCVHVTARISADVFASAAWLCIRVGVFVCTLLCVFVCITFGHDSLLLLPPYIINPKRSLNLYSYF